MQGELIELTDGSKLEVKVNFATLYYIQKEHLDKLITKDDSIRKGKEMELAAKLIHVILLSNGRKVTFDEALQLVPIDTEQVEKIFDEFVARLKKYKKKEQAKKNAKMLH